MRINSIVLLSVLSVSTLAFENSVISNILTRSSILNKKSFAKSPVTPLIKRETKREAAQRIRAAKLKAFQAVRAKSVAEAQNFAAAATSKASIASVAETSTPPPATLDRLAALSQNSITGSTSNSRTSTSTSSTANNAFENTATNLNAASIQAIALAAAKKVRCGSDAACQKQFAAAGITLGPGGAAVCNLGTRKCVNGCAAGFNFGPDGFTCVASVKQCGVQDCGKLNNGYFTCANNSCSPQCNTDTGFSLVSSGSGFACINAATNAAHCGSARIACPASYNGSGVPTCRGGTCSLACPPGQGVRTTLSPGSGAQRYCAS